MAERESGMVPAAAAYLRYERGLAEGRCVVCLDDLDAPGRWSFGISLRGLPVRCPGCGGWYCRRHRHVIRRRALPLTLLVSIVRVFGDAFECPYCHHTWND